MSTVVVDHPLGDNPATASLIYGVDVREALQRIPEQSVQTVCTSPPYWSLRDYGSEGQIGQEDTPQEYVKHMVDVFREIWRVLRDDGTVWLNLGDSYNSQGTNMPNQGGLCPCSCQQMQGKRISPLDPSLKPKDLVGIPWRVAFALQDDGWYLRSDIIWVKKNPMPEPVQDRPTKAHEYVFLLTKKSSYFYDQEAIREPWADGRQGCSGDGDKKSERNRGGRTDGFTTPYNIDPSANGGRNKRTVWNINPSPYKGAHFATWPEKLVEPMVLAGTSECGACAFCGAPWKRIVTKGEPDKEHKKACGADKSGEYKGQAVKDYEGTGAENASDVKRRILDGLRKRSYHWEPTCECEENPTARCVVLDPFSGSATTGKVALEHGLDYIGIDLNAEYLPLAVARLQGRPAPEASEDTEESVLDLF